MAVDVTAVILMFHKLWGHYTPGQDPLNDTDAFIWQSLCRWGPQSRPGWPLVPPPTQLLHWSLTVPIIIDHCRSISIIEDEEETAIMPDIRGPVTIGRVTIHDDET